MAVGGSRDSNIVGSHYSIGDMSGIVGMASSHSIGIRKTMSNLGWGVSISFGFSFSLGNEVPVVSKDARVSKVGASIAVIRKGVVGGDNRGGSVVGGDNGRGSVVGRDNSWGSVIGGNNSGG